MSNREMNLAQPESTWQRNLPSFYPLILVCAVLWAYANSFPGIFILDDPFTIPGNPLIKSLWPLTDAMTGPTGAPSAGRPLVALSFTLDYQWAGECPAGYRVTNVLIHLANTLLLFVLIGRSLRRTPGLTRHARELALIMALLWGVHPINTSAVTYISQRAEALMAFFFLLSFVGIESSHRGDPRHLKKAGAVLAAWACVLCKEVAVALPLLAFLYDRAFIYPTYREAGKARWVFYAALTTPWIFALGIQFIIPRGNTVQFFYQVINPWTYLCTQTNAITMYLRQLLCLEPYLLDYGWPIALHVSEYGMSMLVVTGMFVATIWALIFHPRVGFLGASFFIILAPSSSVIPIITEIMAEHRMYLPGLLVILLAVLGCYRLIQWGRPPLALPVLAVLGTIATFFLGQVTRAQNERYASEKIFWTYNAQHTPKNRRVWYNLGMTEYRQRHFEEAIKAFEQAIRWSPDYPEPHARLTEIYSELKKHDLAIRYGDLCVQYEPHVLSNHLLRSQAYYHAGYWREALQALKIAFERDPNYQDGMQYYVVILLGQELYDDALKQLSIWTHQETYSENNINFAISLARKTNMFAAVPPLEAKRRPTPLPPTP